MDKRQIKKLLIFASLNLFLIGGFLFNHAKDDIFNTRANNPLGCADYFAESNDYSSIYEINQDLIAGTADRHIQDLGYGHEHFFEFKWKFQFLRSIQ